MDYSIFTLIALLLPLMAFLLISLAYFANWNRSEAGEKGVGNLAQYSLMTSWLLLSIATVWHSTTGISAGRYLSVTWLMLGNIDISFNLLLDKLSLALASGMSLIMWLVTRFSINYLHREAGFLRFLR